MITDSDTPQIAANGVIEFVLPAELQYTTPIDLTSQGSLLFLLSDVPMDPNNEFIEVENRIRALTTILKNLDYHITPLSDPKDFPSFLRHFVNLLTTGDRKCSEKVVAMTGSILPDGKVSTLVVTQNPSPKSGVENLCIKDVSKSEKSFDAIVDLKR